MYSEYLIGGAVSDHRPAPLAAAVAVAVAVAEHDDAGHEVAPHRYPVLDHHEGCAGEFEHPVYRIPHVENARRVEIGRRFVEND